MTHALTLHLPTDIYAPLAAEAQRNGETPEQLAAQWLEARTRELEVDPTLVTAPNDFPEKVDPICKWIGALQSNMPGWSNDHDKYIGEAELHRPSDAGG